MFFILEVISGPAAGRQFEVPSGIAASFGRTIRSQFVIGEDAHLSGAHFSVEHTGSGYLVRDLGSTNGTFLNNVRITEAEAGPDDVFSAGNSTFHILPSVLDDWNGFPAEKKAFLSMLYGAGEPVFAVLDATFENRIAQYLAEYRVESSPLCLDSAGTAPFLAALPRDSRLLGPLFNEGWGRNWGIFLTSQAAFPKILSHLKSLLTFTTEDGRTLYFRYYDPRVLRVYLQNRPPQQLLFFYGPVSRFVMQAENPAASVEFRRPDPWQYTYTKGAPGNP